MDLLQDFFILKSCLPGIPIGMERKCPLLNEVKHPGLDAAHVVNLCLCAFTTITEASLRVFKSSRSRKRFKTPTMAEMQARKTTSSDLSWLCDSNLFWAIDRVVVVVDRTNVQFDL